MPAPDRSSSRSRQRVLSPPERISEVLFGLIMVLSFTGSLSVATAGRSDVRELLVGAIGCNTAWGIVDAAMFLLGILLERGRAVIALRALRGPDPASGRAAVAEALPAAIGDALGEEQLETVRRVLASVPEPGRKMALTLQDARGALGVFLLVFLSTIPVVLPFVFVTDVQRAMRLSNAVAIVMLFAGGAGFGRYAGLSPLRTGLAMVALGAVLVAVTIALGG